MSADEKTYRTAAFHTNKPGYLYRYWVLSPSYNKQGYQIKEHEKDNTSGSSFRIADGLSEREAFEMLKELETQAGKKLTRVTASAELGSEYRNAEYYGDHNNMLTATIIQERLNKKRPKFKLGPK
jgi:hypothetical protein